MTKPRAVVRQWSLLRTLAQHRKGLSLQDMAAHMAVNERTIRRDINLFVQAGVPLRETVGRHGQKMWRVDSDSTATPPPAGFEDGLAMALVALLFSPLPDSGLFAATERMRSKALSLLTAGDRKMLEDVLARGLGAGTIKPSALAPLLNIEAIWRSADSQS